MKTWIKLNSNIDKKDYELINKLQKICFEYDKLDLKLELDYKLQTPVNDKMNDINEFMYFDGEELIGYIGICSIREDAPLEVNGMVHPKYRHQGIFKTLNQLVMDEWKRRKSESILLICDQKSKLGLNFIKNIGAIHHHTEYDMFLATDNFKTYQTKYNIKLRKATNLDAYEIARQNTIYFNKPEDSHLILPEDEEIKGMRIYLAEKDQHVIGKIHLELYSGVGAIFGFGVLPEYRKKGFGRDILLTAINQLISEGAEKIILQVDSENNIAYNLYKNCGFIEKSAMGYYEIKKVSI